MKENEINFLQKVKKQFNVLTIIFACLTVVLLTTTIIFGVKNAQKPTTTPPAVSDENYFICVDKPEGKTLIGVTLEGMYQTTLTIPEDVKHIGKQALYNCKTLVTVNIPSSVETIYDYAFEFLFNLQNINFAENSNLKRIGKYAFYYCQDLLTVNIPQNVEIIDEGAFEDCNNAVIYINNENITLFSRCFENVKVIIAQDDVANKLSTTTNYTVVGTSNIYNNEFVIFGDELYAYFGTNKNVVIPNIVKEIQGGAFYECSFIETITIPDGVEYIGPYCFYGVNKVKTLTIPESVTEIDNYAFASMTSLESVDIKAKITSLSDGLFEYCIKLKEVKLPNTLQNIYEGVFYNNRSLKEIIIPESVLVINDYAFSGCSSLEKIVLPTNLETVGSYAFEYCNNLLSIEIPASVVNMGYGAFYGWESNQTIYLLDRTEIPTNFPYNWCEDATVEFKASENN